MVQMSSLSCHFFGTPCCITRGVLETICEDTASLRLTGYKVIEEWEDDWDFEALHDLLLEGFLKYLVVVRP